METMMSASNASESARALSAVGAAKGGKARAERLTEEERQDIARRAAEARWGTEIPKAEYTGELIIAGRRISCAVLTNGKRLLTQESVLKAVGRAGKAKGGKGSVRLTGDERLVNALPPFLAAENLYPFISDELRDATSPVVFRNPKGRKAYGYDAKLLPMICDVYLKARDANVVLTSQRHIVEACDLLMRGLAHVGIIALVDEATGYQAYRERDELNRILEAYIQEELRPWIQTFPEEFFRQVYRIHGWEYKPTSSQRTPFVGKLINDWIYKELPPNILPKLQELNPVTEKGYRKNKHHQYLTADTGIEHLDKQIDTVTTLLRVSEDRDQFDTLFARAFGKPVRPKQAKLPLVIDVD
ncbi:MAG: P63C domain-containing protein [Chloroflexota bacterium]|nr:P63C domain-containing protein [Chloroflexota bacterium]